jgi:CBS domain-containing protein
MDGANDPVAELIEEAVIRVSPDASLEGVADLLAAGEIGALVVGDEESVSGIISERDLVHAIARRKNLRATTAGEVATSSLVWCDASAPITEAATLMMDRYVRHVLVEKDGQLVGIVSARDLLGALALATRDID